MFRDLFRTKSYPILFRVNFPSRLPLLRTLYQMDSNFQFMSPFAIEIFLPQFSIFLFNCYKWFKASYLGRFSFCYGILSMFYSFLHPSLAKRRLQAPSFLVFLVSPRFLRCHGQVPMLPMLMSMFYVHGRRNSNATCCHMYSTY